MDIDKGLNHVGHLHLCTGVTLEQGLPSKNHHQEIWLGSVIPCHCLPLLPCWVSNEPVYHFQMSGFLLYQLLHKSISDALHGGSWEMGVLLGWQVWKIHFLAWKHDMVMVLNVIEWEHSYFHTQYLLMWVLIQKDHSIWSQSNWIILPPLPVIGAGWNHYRRRLCTLSWWWHWTSEGPGHLSKTVVLQLRHSTWRIWSKWPVFSSINGEEFSWCKSNFVMLYKLIYLRFILRTDSNSVNVSKWCLMCSQSKTGGMCSLI